MVQVHNVSEMGGSILECVTDLRDVQVHSERERFRRNMERVGFLLANELSKTLAYEKTLIETPLAKTEGFRLASQPVVATILRAGRPALWRWLAVSALGVGRLAGRAACPRRRREEKGNSAQALSREQQPADWRRQGGAGDAFPRQPFAAALAELTTAAGDVATQRVDGQTEMGECMADRRQGLCAEHATAVALSKAFG